MFPESRTTESTQKSPKTYHDHSQMRDNVLMDSAPVEVSAVFERISHS